MNAWKKSHKIKLPASSVHEGFNAGKADDTATACHLSQPRSWLRLQLHSLRHTYPGLSDYPSSICFISFYEPYVETSQAVFK